MAVFKELLEYQKVDGELRKIEQELAQSDERKKFVQAKKFMETAAEKLESQDNRARNLKAHVAKLSEEFEEIGKNISEYAELDELVESGGDIAFYKKSVQNLVDRLRAMKGEIAQLNADIEAACEEYKKMKKQTIAMQKQYKEYNEKYKEVRSSRAEEVQKINERLEKIGANIPPEILERYKAKRKDKIFPVVAPLMGDMCICGMNFSLAQQGALAGGGVIECEHCRRFIYKEN